MKQILKVFVGFVIILNTQGMNDDGGFFQKAAERAMHSLPSVDKDALSSSNIGGSGIERPENFRGGSPLLVAGPPEAVPQPDDAPLPVMNDAQRLWHLVATGDVLAAEQLGATGEVIADAIAYGEMQGFPRLASVLIDAVVREKGPITRIPYLILPSSSEGDPSNWEASCYYIENPTFAKLGVMNRDLKEDIYRLNLLQQRMVTDLSALYSSNDPDIIYECANLVTGFQNPFAMFAVLNRARYDDTGLLGRLLYLIRVNDQNPIHLMEYFLASTYSIAHSFCSEPSRWKNIGAVLRQVIGLSSEEEFPRNEKMAFMLNGMCLGNSVEAMKRDIVESPSMPNLFFFLENISPYLQHIRSPEFSQFLTRDMAPFYWALRHTYALAQAYFRGQGCTQNSEKAEKTHTRYLELVRVYNDVMKNENSITPRDLDGRAIRA